MLTGTFLATMSSVEMRYQLPWKNNLKLCKSAVPYLQAWFWIFSCERTYKI